MENEDKTIVETIDTVETVEMVKPKKSDNFDRCLGVILHHEGGYVNHPKDPGGMTNLGVTKRVFEEWVDEEVTETQMRALTPEDVTPIYKKNYWDKCRCGDLPVGLDLCVFDFAVNAGPSRSIRYLQNVVGSKQDGIIGKKTLKAVEEHADTIGVESLIKVFQSARQDYYQGLKTFASFGRGWTRRVKETTTKALEMA